MLFTILYDKVNQPGHLFRIIAAGTVVEDYIGAAGQLTRKSVRQPAKPMLAPCRLNGFCRFGFDTNYIAYTDLSDIVSLNFLSQFSEDFR